jgi:hypothetical protein
MLETTLKGIYRRPEVTYIYIIMYSTDQNSAFAFGTILTIYQHISYTGWSIATHAKWTWTEAYHYSAAV